MHIIFPMKRVLIVVSIYLLQNGYLAEAVTTVATNIQEFSKQDVINAVYEIGRKISYAQWAKDSPPKNVILSPLSIAVILNLLMHGSNGKTNLEIREALSYPNDLQESVVHETYEEIFTSLPQSEDDIELSLYTRLFPQQGFPILESFTNVSETSYLSETESLDYANFPNASTDRINNWVSDSTNGKIQELFPEPLSPLTVCVIVNVIFLNATWEYQFSSSETKNGNFYTGTETITIPMMNRKMHVPYKKFGTERFEMISLPYVGNRFSMYILKPICDCNLPPILNDYLGILDPICCGDLQQIENDLSSNDLNTFINQMEAQQMNVTIPRMKLDLELDLKIDLMSFGVEEIFRITANFTRFTYYPGVYVTNIYHKAILEISEEGTIAAAATGASVGITAIMDPPPILELNEPSLIFIRDNENSLILFGGRVMKPEPFLG